MVRRRSRKDSSVDEDLAREEFSRVLREEGFLALVSRHIYGPPPLRRSNSRWRSISEEVIHQHIRVVGVTFKEELARCLLERDSELPSLSSADVSSDEEGTMAGTSLPPQLADLTRSRGNSGRRTRHREPLFPEYHDLLWSGGAPPAITTEIKKLAYRLAGNKAYEVLPWAGDWSKVDTTEYCPKGVAAVLLCQLWRGHWELPPEHARTGEFFLVLLMLKEDYVMDDLDLREQHEWAGIVGNEGYTRAYNRRRRRGVRA